MDVYSIWKPQLIITDVRIFHPLTFWFTESSRCKTLSPDVLLVKAAENYDIIMGDKMFDVYYPVCAYGTRIDIGNTNVDFISECV